MLADDMGYADVACYGSQSQEFNEIDQLAAEGIRFTQFYSGDSLCTPARSALLTGRLPVRTGIFSDNSGHRIFLPSSTGGLPLKEFTLAEMFKSGGYATGMVGKWHLGINRFNRSDGSYLPRHHGFDFVGLNLPFSNAWQCDESGIFYAGGPKNDFCFLYRDTNIVQQPINHTYLTEDLLKDYRKFVKTNRKKPFFFYFSFPQPHTNLFSWMTKFHNASNRGMYGGDIAEMAWAVGEIKKELIEQRLDQDTILIFMSDHGPHKEVCLHGGETGGLRGGKATTWEGGFRIPAIIRWPGMIKPGQVSHSVISALDLLPTLAQIASITLPKRLVLDGKPLMQYFISAFNVNLYHPIFYYCNRRLMAFRYGEYKLHYYTTRNILDKETKLYCPGGMPLKHWFVSAKCPDSEVTKHDPPIAFNIAKDAHEKYPFNYKLVPLQARVQIERIIHQHSVNLIKVQSEVDNRNADVNPCCNPLKCVCNYV